jgi:parallel beta-helix repeat protein
MHGSPGAHLVVRRLLLAVCALMLALWAAPVAAKTVYVDQDSLGGPCSNASGNPGTSLTSPVCSCAEGQARLASGDTLYIRAATYPVGTGCFFGSYPNAIPSGGGSWETATKILGYPGDAKPILLEGGVALGKNSLNENWVIFGGFELRNGGATCSQACHHLRFQDNDLYEAVDSPYHGYMLIESHAAEPIAPATTPHHMEILRNRVHNAGGGVGGSGVAGDAAVYGAYGAYVSFNNSIIDGNIFYDAAGYGIHLYWQNQQLVSDNVISNNIFYNNAFRTRQVYSEGNGAAVILSSGARNKFYNNVVYGNAGGLQLARCDDCEVYNNTIYGNVWAISIESGTNMIVRNNLLFGNRDSEILLPFGAPAGLVLQDNWQTANGNPRLVNPATKPCFGAGSECFAFPNAESADWHLQGTSPARNARACIAGFASPLDGIPGLNVDFKNTLYANSPGLTRPQSPTPPGATPCEPGAYEFQEGSVPPPTCPPDCPVDESPTVNPVIVSTGGHGDTPSDSNGCRTAETVTTPKATLASALACMTVPSKKLWLRGGTHAGFVDTGTTPITGGPNWSAPTILESYPAETAVLQLPATNNGATLFFRAASDRYIKVQRLTLDGMSRAVGAGGGDGILIYSDAQFLRFENLTVRNDRYHNFVNIGASDIDLLTSTLTNALTDENIRTFYGVQNFLVSGNTLTTSPAGGVLIDPTGDAQNVTVAKNSISGTTVGVDVGAGTGTLVQNNVIQSESGSGIRVRSGATGTKVYQNDSVANSGTGIVCDSGASGVDIANNIVVANGTQMTNSCGALDRGNLKTGTLAEIFTTVPVLKTTVPVSPAINSGVDLPSVTDDQIGNARPFAGQWDAGAREAQSAPAPGPTTGVSIRVMMFF